LIQPDANGSQQLGLRIRTDCIGEASGAMAAGAWSAHLDPTATATATELLNYLFFSSRAQQGARADPASPLGGIILWGTNVVGNNGRRELYSDDQYRTLLSVLFATAALNSSRWHLPMAKMLLGNVRITSPDGYTQWLGTDETDLLSKGWR
jgi:hypothetical protein